MAAKASSLRIDWQTFLQSRGPRSAIQRSVIQRCLAHLRDGPASTSSLSHPKWKNGGACDFSSPPHRSPPQSKCHEASAMEAGCPAPTRISSSPDTKFQLSFSLFPLFAPAVPLHGATHRYGEAQIPELPKDPQSPMRVCGMPRLSLKSSVMKNGRLSAVTASRASWRRSRGVDWSCKGPGHKPSR